jgi:ABC-2 type transport system permease protein
MSTIVANAGLINKVYVPKYVFPLTKCMFVGINFALSLIPLYVVLIVTGTGVCWQHIFLLYAFGCLFLFTLGAGLLLATITVYLRDMFYIYSIILQILSYMTPIFWHPTIIGSPTILAILKLNPLYHIIDFARTILLYQQTPTALQFGLCLLFGLVMLGIGSFVFKKYQNEFIYHI